MKPLHVLMSLLLGLVLGALGFDFGNAYEAMLYLLVFLIGADIGLNFKTEELRRAGRYVALPFLTLAGSLLGGLVAALVLGIGPRWGLAIGAGCGWYSLTGPLIAQYSAVYGAVGFLGNLAREILTIVLYPTAAKRFGPVRAIALGGATTMDTTLPVITKFGGREVALIAFVHGLVLTALVSLLVPLILTL